MPLGVSLRKGYAPGGLLSPAVAPEWCEYTKRQTALITDVFRLEKQGTRVAFETGANPGEPLVNILLKLSCPWLVLARAVDRLRARLVDQLLQLFPAIATAQ